LADMDAAVIDNINRLEDQLRRAQELGLLQAIHPALRLEPAALRALEAAPPGAPLLALWAALVHGIAPSDLRLLEKRLALPRAWSRVARDAVALGQRLARLDDAGLRPSQVFHLLEGLDQRAVQAWAILRDGSSAGQWLRRFLTDLCEVKAEVNGERLLALGVPEGPQVGILLEQLRDGRLDGALRSREDEEGYVRRWLSSAPPLAESGSGELKEPGGPDGGVL